MHGFRNKGQSTLGIERQMFLGHTTTPATSHALTKLSQTIALGKDEKKEIHIQK